MKPRVVFKIMVVANCWKKVKPDQPTQCSRMEGPLAPAVFGQQWQEELWGPPSDRSSRCGFLLGELCRGLA